MMHARRLKLASAALAGTGLIVLAGCTSEDMAMFADAMAEASDEMAVTLTSVPSFGCDYNIDGYLVCDRDRQDLEPEPVHLQWKQPTVRDLVL